MKECLVLIKGSVQLVLHKIFSLICSVHDDAGSSCSRQQGKQALILINVFHSSYQYVLRRAALRLRTNVLTLNTSLQ